MSSSATLIRQLKEDTVIRYPRDVEEALSELSGEQRKFALLHASGETQAAAYAMAYEGVTPEAARSSGSRIMQIDQVQLAVRKLRNWIESRIIQSNPEAAAEFCYRRWLEWGNGDDRGSAIRATELIAKAAGLFVSRSEVTHRHILDIDAADSQLTQMLADLGLDDTIDAVFHVEHPQYSVEQSRETSQVLSNQSLTKPTLGVCPHCGHAL